MGLDHSCGSVAERLVGVKVEGGFEGFDAVEEGGDSGMVLALEMVVLVGGGEMVLVLER